MNVKRIAVFLLAVIMGWVFVPPIQTVASYAQGNSQTVSQTPNSSGEEEANQTSKVGGSESESKKEVITSNDTSTKSNKISSRSSGTPSQTASATSRYEGRSYSTTEVQQLIRDYSAQYGISADLPLRVASCESGFSYSSKNRSSTASGVFQYLASTWRNTEAGKQGLSVFDARANVEMAVKSIASGGISNWSASKSCWSNN